jgi:hypothetical protein
VSLPRSKTRSEFLAELAEKTPGVSVYAPTIVERQRIDDGRCRRCGRELPMWWRLRRFVLCGRCGAK